MNRLDQAKFNAIDYTLPTARAQYECTHCGIYFVNTESVIGYLCMSCYYAYCDRCCHCHTDIACFAMVLSGIKL